jgi:hypothetical protein
MKLPDETEGLSHILKNVQTKKYQRIMYLRRKSKLKALEEAKLKEKSERLKQQILASEGILQSLREHSSP